MAENKIIPWAQTGTANVLSDDAYASDVSKGGLYGDGVKTGQASSQQANKTWRQATAPGAGLGQFLVDNLDVDVTDADTPTTFSARIANAVLKLAQISPFNQSWATSTVGYRKYAIVSDTSGNFWVSTSEQNTTVPGADGAKWRSLFNGYTPTPAAVSGAANVAIELLYYQPASRKLWVNTYNQSGSVISKRVVCDDSWSEYVSGTTGYRISPDGRIQQWGIATFPNSGTPTSNIIVQYPIKFPNACTNASANALDFANTTAGCWPSVSFYSAPGSSAMNIIGDTLSHTGTAQTNFNKTAQVMWKVEGY